MLNGLIWRVSNMSKKSISRSFIETFEPLMKGNKFSRKGKIFHRIVNGEIVQLLSYYSFAMTPRFTIQFWIWPLCDGYEYMAFMDGSRLCEVFKDVPAWEYEYQSDGYIRHMPTALNATEERLFAIFDSVVDYSSYFKWQDIGNQKNLNDNRRYAMSLLFGNYSDCQQSKEIRIKNRLIANQKRWGVDYHIVPQRQEEFDQECKDYYRMKEAMEKNDRKTIEEYIHSQEQKSLNSYIKAFFSQKKYEKYQETGILPFESVNICPTT